MLNTGITKTVYLEVPNPAESGSGSLTVQHSMTAKIGILNL